MSEKCVDEREAATIPVLRIPNIVSEKVQFSGMKYARLSEHEFCKRTLCLGDILVVRTNGSKELVGRCAVVDTVTEKTVFGSHLIRLRLKKNITSIHSVHAWHYSILREQRQGNIALAWGDYDQQKFRFFHFQSNVGSFLSLIHFKQNSNHSIFFSRPPPTTSRLSFHHSWTRRSRGNCKPYPIITVITSKCKKTKMLNFFSDSSTNDLKYLKKRWKN
jgi:hypothetical protein